MSNYGITPEGFKRKRLDQIRSELNESFRAAFGDNWDTDPDAPQGQVVGSVAEVFADLWEMAEGAYNAFNPSAAQDDALSSLVQLNYLERNEARPTVVQLLLTGSPNTVISEGSLVSIEDGAQFATNGDVTLDSSGEGYVMASAVETGPILAEPGTITVIDTPVTGWAAVENPEAGVLGREEESNPALRSRRARSTAINSLNLLESLISGLLSTEGVAEVSVLENDTDFEDDNGLPPHSFECVVLGGEESDIGDTIWLRHPFGIESHGDNEITINDSQGFPHVVRYSRPIAVDIYITIEVDINDDYPDDGDTQLKQSILDYANGLLIDGVSIGIGQAVRFSRLYTPLNRIRGHSIDSLAIGRDPSPTGQSNLEMEYNERAQFTMANINVIGGSGE